MPMTAEACALHYADNLDAHVQYFGQVISDGTAAGNRWSDFQRLFDRYIFVGARGVRRLFWNFEPMVPPDLPRSRLLDWLLRTDAIDYAARPSAPRR